ncbi:MAG: amidase [Thermoguttaceae bacterium]|jgi:aspartyl-tRNA(Asn)/glutamyl-tRNA(Gln) amidotransferase subunit A|nr:amidase [Thermoguttaceae bacterium]
MPDVLSLWQGAQQVREGQLDPAAWVNGCLEHIARLDARLHAWVLVDADEARRTARERAVEAARGEYRGPLHGVPVGIKDIIDVAGLPTEVGSPLRKGQIAAEDAPLVARLREAGAIVLGKTVTVEFACFDPSPTRNPWDPKLRHTPGGSSSGSAVAVATGMCPGAIGTQTGGSLVRPASYCGIAALKPTFGQVSTEGIVPVSYHFDHPGPMARWVEDLALLWQCLRQDGPTSSHGKPCPAGGLNEGRPPRLGWIEVFAEHADATIGSVTEAALTKLREAGATVVPVQFPEPLVHVQAQHRRIMAVEAAAYHRVSFKAYRKQYGPMISGLLDEGLSISGTDYADALAWQRQFGPRVAELLADCDALIAPATDTTAPPTLETTGSNLFQAPFSCAGLPVVSLPCGLGADGMPAAVQLVGRPCREDDLLALAGWCERQFGFAVQNPWPAV